MNAWPGVNNATAAAHVFSALFILHLVPGHAGEDCEDHLYDNGHSATRSATGVRHGDTVGVESDAFCVYRRGKQVRVDLLGYLVVSFILFICGGNLPTTK